VRRAGIEPLVAGILRFGGVASAALIVLGVLLLGPQRATERQLLDEMLTAGQPSVVRISPGSVLAEAAVGRPASIIMLGVLLLILTPVARVIAGAVYYAARRDRIYTLISLAVLGLLAAGFVLGRVR
jgi:uncharacterized membrane protein